MKGYFFMELFTIVFLSLGLAMDASAVSMTNGICYPSLSKKKALFTALVFGLFQGIMPLIGYYFGIIIQSFIQLVGNWFAFIILSLIGYNMIHEGYKEMKHPDGVILKEHLPVFDIIIQGLATSIDALVVGITLTPYKTNIWAIITIISLITFGCCILSVIIGKKFGSIMKNKAPILGGAILMAIAFKFLLGIFI
jgi:putative Mn2+ efflux pump MntP